MKSVVKGTATALALWGMVGQALASGACARPSEAIALKTAAMQQELMVAALYCNDVGLYNRFVVSYQHDLQNSDAALLSFFRAWSRRCRRLSRLQDEPRQRFLAKRLAWNVGILPSCAKRRSTLRLIQTAIRRWRRLSRVKTWARKDTGHATRRWPVKPSLADHRALHPTDETNAPFRETAIRGPEGNFWPLLHSRPSPGPAFFRPRSF